MNVRHFAFVIAAVTSIAANAQTTTTERIDTRQQNQTERIEKGVASGQLNQREAARLEQGQSNVQKMEEKAMADGKVTGKEKARIERAQDRQSGRIASQRHDAQHAKK